MTGKAEISVLEAPVSDGALDQLASVLVDCVAGGASVSFMAPFSHDEALVFFRKVASSVAAGDTVLLAAEIDGKIVGTVQLGLDTPPNQPHRADLKKMLVHRSARGRGIGADLMARVEEEAQTPGPLAAGARYRARRKRLSPLQAGRLDRERNHSGLRDVSGWQAVRHRVVLEAAGPVIAHLMAQAVAAVHARTAKANRRGLP